MSANKLDQTTYNEVAANTVFDGVLDAPKILTWRQNVQSVVNQHADQINAIAATGGTPLELNQQSIINGNMEVNQRVGPYTHATATSAYTVDRMRSMNTGSGVNATASQVAVADLDGSNFGLQFVHAAAPIAQGKLMHGYTLEARDSYKLAGQTRTISVKVKGVAGMNKAQLFARYRTTEGAISDTSTLIGSSVVVDIAPGAWTDVSLTVTLPNRTTLTANGCIGYLIVFSKSSAEASGDGAIIAQWHDNAGIDVKPFQPRSFVDELALCRRYFQVIADSGIPNQIGYVGTNFYHTMISRVLGVEMRIAPTMVCQTSTSGIIPISSMVKGTHYNYAQEDAATTSDNTNWDSFATYLNTVVTSKHVSIRGHRASGAATYVYWTMLTGYAFCLDSEL